ncbi:hypothetical protein Droror1_Dr00027271 [Drosera rotundifolia]
MTMSRKSATITWIQAQNNLPRPRIETRTRSASYLRIHAPFYRNQPRTTTPTNWLHTPNNQFIPGNSLPPIDLHHSITFTRLTEFTSSFSSRFPLKSSEISTRSDEAICLIKPSPAQHPSISHHLLRTPLPILNPQAFEHHVPPHHHRQRHRPSIPFEQHRQFSIQGFEPYPPCHPPCHRQRATTAAPPPPTPASFCLSHRAFEHHRQFSIQGFEPNPPCHPPCHRQRSTDGGVPDSLIPENSQVALGKETLPVAKVKQLEDSDSRSVRSDPVKELLADAKTKSKKLEVESKGQKTAPSDFISCHSCLDCPCPKGL